MQNSTLKIALGALVLIGLPAVFLAWRDGGRWFAENPTDGAELALPALVENPASVQRIELTQGQESLSLLRAADGSWTLPDKGGFAAKDEAVMKLVRGLAELELVEAKTARVDRHAKVGLVAPADGGEVARLVRALDGTGEPVAELLLGDGFFEATFPALFVRRPDDDQTWLAMGQVPGTPAAAEWMDREVLSFEREEVREARIERLEPPAPGYITAREDAAAYDFTLADVPEGREPAAGHLVSALARIPQSLRFEDVAPRDSIDLAGADRSLAQFETFDGITVVLDAHHLTAESDPAQPTWITLEFGLTDSAGAAPAGPPAPETDGAEGPAEPDEPTRAELEQRTAELTARHSAWTYRLETATATALLRSAEELTVDPADPAEADAGGNPLENMSQEELQALIESATQGQGGG